MVVCRLWFVGRSSHRLRDRVLHLQHLQVSLAFYLGQTLGLHFGHRCSISKELTHVLSISSPVREVADACKTGAATNIIFGMALGYKSVIVPVFAIAASIYLSFTFAAMYGIAVAALGMLGTLSTGLAIDAYGPISDNAGGIAEMAGMNHAVRERTDALDAAGNTTAAIGKVSLRDTFICYCVVSFDLCTR